MLPEFIISFSAIKSSVLTGFKPKYKITAQIAEMISGIQMYATHHGIRPLECLTIAFRPVYAKSCLLRAAKMHPPNTSTTPAAINITGV